ncbi:CAP domain-containing protein [Bosea caraganae]|uniref:CAP domain-containing protein n=1 Tax=Bosea caraganae TaxID=2763117 RepID=A0A370L8E6_9HYPH|nr:CAP domain-containing protein [Bosea caraganae]RDJ26663.1 CAP domain-containing protein [Bosea caraganae]RDJ30550.1 CAP domain-containing protein [Bosea caraganae]
MLNIRTGSWGAALGVALLIAGCAGEPRRAGPINEKTLQSVANVRVDPAGAIRMLNAYRAGRGLGPVRLDPLLTAMAQRQADAMAASNNLSHDAAGNFFSRVAAAGLDTVRAGENLGGGYYSTEEAFAGWRSSSEHNANLLMPQATRFGIALAKDPRTQYRTYWAMVVAAEPEKRSEGPGVLMSPLGPVGAGDRR